MDEVESERELDLREYARVLRRRKWVVVVCIAVVAVIAAGYSLTRPKEYSATAKVLVPLPANTSTFDPTQTGSADPSTQARQLQDEVAFAQGDTVTSLVKKDLGHKPQVGVSADTTADTISFTATGRNQSAVANEANVYANTYLEQRRKAYTADYIKTSQILQQKLQQLQSERQGLAPTDPQAQALQGSINVLGPAMQNLQLGAQLATSGGQVIAQAKTPTAPISRQVPRNTILFALLGLGIGIVLAFVVDRLDDSVKAKHHLEAATHGLLTLGIVPRIGTWKNSKETRVISLERPAAGAAEAYRTIRTSLQFLELEHPLHVIGFTSSKAGEGKTATVANLGVALARAGQRVVMVCCDMRRPRIHQFFGMSNAQGITSVLLGDLTLRDALQPVPDQPRLLLLASGPLPPNPSELLSLDGVRTILSALREHADYVLIDCPPVLPVPDALQISRLVDGMVLVTAARQTSRREVARAAEMLRQIDAPLVGTVLNGVLQGGGYGYDYGYYYRAEYTSYAQDEVTTNGNGQAVSANGNGAATNGPRSSSRRMMRRRARDLVDAEAEARFQAAAEGTVAVADDETTRPGVPPPPSVGGLGDPGAAGEGTNGSAGGGTLPHYDA